MKGKIMKKLRRFWKRLCVGLAASAKERDITHGKIDKFGGTGMKAAMIVAVPLLMVTSVEAQTATSPHAALMEGNRSAEATRSFRDYIFSRDGAQTLLEHLNGSDPYGANAIARSLEHSGVPLSNASMPGDQVFGSPIMTGPLGGYQYRTVCDY